MINCNMALRLFITWIGRWYLGILLLLLFGAETPQIANAFRPFLGGHCQNNLLRQCRGISSIGSSHGVLVRKNIDAVRGPSQTSLSCGLLDALQKAFGGVATTTAKATASHILVQGGPEAKRKLLDIKVEIGEDSLKFGDAAAKYSDCSSASKGGDLGEFDPGKMAKEFDDVVFDPQTPIGVVQGPIQTEFGYHLILVKERTE
jgi:peptidyl-prolyl cis-trans isomerase C